MKVFIIFICLLFSTCCIAQNELSQSQEVTALFDGLSLKLSVPREVIIKKYSEPTMILGKYYSQYWEIGDTTYSLFSIGITIEELSKNTFLDKNYLDSLNSIQLKEDSFTRRILVRDHTESNELTTINGYKTIKSVGWISTSAFLYRFVSFKFIEKNKVINIHYRYLNYLEKQIATTIQRNILALKLE